MASARSVRAQLFSSRITAALILTIVILLSRTAAKPESEYLTEGFTNPETISRFRWDVTEAVQKGYTYTPGVGAHKVYTNGKEWSAARTICQEEGGDLAVINSRAEAHVIADLFTATHSDHYTSDKDNMLIGYHDMDSEGKFVTVDNRSLADAGYEEWREGEPNEWGNHGEDCGAVYVTGKLNDVSCFKRMAFVCEMPIHDHVVPTVPADPRDIPDIEGTTGCRSWSESKSEKSDLEKMEPSSTPGLVSHSSVSGAQFSHGAKGVMILILFSLHLLATKSYF